MNPRLRNILVGVGVVTLSGVAYLIARPGDDVAPADLKDAGITDDCTRVAIRCEGRVVCGENRRMRTVDVQAYLCPPPERATILLPDGGQLIEDDGNTLPDGGRPPVLIPRWPRAQGRECFEPRGSLAEACEVIAGVDGGCNDGELCGDADEPPQRPAQARCACRARDGGACRWLGGLDGGPVMMALGNVHPLPVQGVACRPAECGIFAGDGDESALHPDCVSQ